MGEKFTNDKQSSLRPPFAATMAHCGRAMISGTDKKVAPFTRMTKKPSWCCINNAAFQRGRSRSPPQVPHKTHTLVGTLALLKKHSGRLGHTIRTNLRYINKENHSVFFKSVYNLFPPAKIILFISLLPWFICGGLALSLFSRWYAIPPSSYSSTVIKQVPPSHGRPPRPPPPPPPPPPPELLCLRCNSENKYANWQHFLFLKACKFIILFTKADQCVDSIIGTTGCRPQKTFRKINAECWFSYNMCLLFFFHILQQVQLPLSFFVPATEVSDYCGTSCIYVVKKEEEEEEEEEEKTTASLPPSFRRRKPTNQAW